MTTFEWQPIETAPKEGNDADFAVFWLPESQRAVTGHTCWWLGNQWSTDDQPTHWMPLPEPPK
jgi:hypothetical protein